MKIVILADIHGQVKSLQRLETPLREADVVLLAGDITNFGDAKKAATVVDYIRQSAARVLAVGGNCDPPQVGNWLAEQGISLHGRAVNIDSWWFVGVSGALSSYSTLPDETGEFLFTEALDRAYEQCEQTDRIVLVTHQPAWQTALDAVSPRYHAGNRAIRAFIERARPKLAVSGHIHEIIGTDRLGPTTLVNPGPAKQGRWAQIDLNGDAVDVRLFP